MSVILVIGGYGGFGSRLCRRLSRAGHELLVAGRSGDRAERFCAGLAGARPLVLDRNGDIGAIIARERPDLAIDAAGPFQSSRYGLPRACIASGIPYLDLADARDFVSGIGALDREARAKGVAVIAGASSAPALTGAVCRKLADGMERVFSVDISLSAANRSSGGESVIAAILSYVGRPIRLWRGRRWAEAAGWQELRREDYVFADGSGLRGRVVALADLPDCELLPDLLPGRPAVSFRAGTELGFQMLALWLASWPVRWGWLSGLGRFRAWLLPLYRLTGRIGGDRSAMSVTLVGELQGRRVERRWTVVAEQGQGLEVPTLAAALLAGDLLEGRIAPGARSAAALLPFERFEPALGELPLRHETAERDIPPPLYARVMGRAFEALPPALRQLHDICRDSGARGEGRVGKSAGRIGRMIAAAMRFPPEGVWPLHVAFAEREGAERWTRDFGGHRFFSDLSEKGGLLVERFGPMRFAFDLPSDVQGLEMKLSGWSAFGIPLPLALGPRIQAREWEEEGRFRFSVAVALPLLGEIVRYSGWLIPLEGEGEGEGDGV